LQSPSDGMSSMDLTDTLLFCVMALLPIGLVKNLLFVKNHAGLEVCGSLEKRLVKVHGHTEAKQAAAITEARHIMHRRSSFNWIFFLACFIVGVLLSGYHYMINKQVDNSHFLWFVQAGMLWVIMPFCLCPIFANVLLICTTTDLMERNIVAYGQLIDLMAWQVGAIYDRETQKMNTSATDTEVLGGVEKLIHHRTVHHPLVSSLCDQVDEYETFLLNVSKVFKQHFEPQINFLYAVLGTGYFFMLFEIYVIYVKVRNLPGGLTENYSDLYKAFGFTICTLLSLLCVAQPLLNMALQAQAWEGLCNKFKTLSHQKASQGLSTSADPFFLYNRHTALQEEFNWHVLGYPMVPSAILGSIGVYFAGVWAAIIWPAIQDYVDSFDN